MQQYQYLVEQLNEPQKEAVMASLGDVLVLAGAGSGKTRVLVQRIAWLIEVEHVFPANILAVTFTNKAAAEMRGRIEDLLAISTRAMWVGTFHSLAHRLLRMHWQEANLIENFQVLDSEDQYRLIRRLIKEMQLDENKWSPRECQWYINQKKDDGQRAGAISQTDNFQEKTWLEIYKRYESTCQQAGLVDFAELLLRTYELFKNSPTLLQHYQERFKHILIDEFQDTNKIQYQWLMLLKTKNNYLMAVGDDDQSIYGWRGAKIENIQNLSSTLKNMTTIRLEQNYRSTSTILDAANALIAHNTTRMGKNLWTAGEPGELIQVYQAVNEQDEGHYIVETAKKMISEGFNRRDIAVLYRSNAQSRILEECFMQAGIPYRVYGGLRFFERAEIKDALAYLRLIHNHADSAAFERIVNTPTRGIGHTTMEILRAQARENEQSLWKAALAAIEHKRLPGRAIKALQNFIDLISHLSEMIQDYEVSSALEVVLEETQLIDHFKKEKGEKGRARVENLQELVSAAKQFHNEEEAISDMQAFLSHAALEAGERQGERFEDCVQLMTLHSVKGLEFAIVFMTGMEEKLFPHQMSIAEEGRLQEERRLCYVGMTRAKQYLFMTFAEMRRLYGQQVQHSISRFIREIPKTYLNMVRMQSITRPMKAIDNNYKSTWQHSDSAAKFRIGDLVQHKTFGEGIVLNLEGMGSQAKVEVNFSKAGRKLLIADFLQKI